MMACMEDLKDLLPVEAVRLDVRAAERELTWIFNRS